ncbi:flavohemoprotein [Pandoraea terrae]|uniref:Flavohemoprotein n=1 Tax=Pandoraea terrae TaxID=1537710 RepID=A0A5E4XGR0_9BURK|nr:NO-inducible flavohemoprotein [Pandoraea terrae]VVE35599.1 flavohemoprotein [Pandoraea terrae]
MLSASARPYIDASVPVLREHGLTITRHFYADMFEAHPELTNLFNMGNQANGSQQQSLASAVFAYAANIDNAAALAPVLERIVHKHMSVGIKPSHYPIVGRHLLGAIKTVLGDAATPELLAAWDEAYWLLAGELIAAEARLSERKGVAPGELRPLTVLDVRRESDNVMSFYLQTADGKSPGEFVPGQYVSVEAAWPESGRRQLRQYSLSDAPQQPWWRISVKREDGTDGNVAAGEVSNWLHANVKAGDTLQVGAPFGDFQADVTGSRPLVLLSAGVGVTPMVSALNAVVASQPKRHVVFAHAARNGRHHALRHDLHHARGQLPNLRTVVFYEAPLDTDRAGVDYDREGRMDLQGVRDLLPADADYLLCGPQPFMQAQWRDLLAAGVNPARLHREVFGPDALDHLL